MNKSKKIIAALLMAAMLVMTGVGSISAFASTDDAQLLSAEGDSIQLDTEASDVKVSGCDLQADKLVKAKVKTYGFSMLVPDGSTTSLDTPKSSFDEVGYSRPYFIKQGCVFQTFTSSENYCAVSLFVEDLGSVFDYYGDYNSLSKEQQEELIQDAKDESESAEFVKINGRSYLESYASDSSNGDVYTQYKFDTVINGIKYSIYIQAANATEADNAVINQMIKSIKLKGKTEMPSVIEIVLVIAVVILIAAVALAYFFLFRINEFMNSDVNEFALIGFDLPAKAAKDEDDEDSDDDYEDDEDEDEDETDEADEVSEDAEEIKEVESSDDDDERIIKD